VSRTLRWLATNIAAPGGFGPLKGAVTSLITCRSPPPHAAQDAVIVDLLVRLATPPDTGACMESKKLLPGQRSGRTFPPFLQTLIRWGVHCSTFCCAYCLFVEVRSAITGGLTWRFQVDDHLFDNGVDEKHPG
jgi:hypothetical protein